MVKKVKRKPIIYIAGPYTQGSEVRNTVKALQTGIQVYVRGGIPLVPHSSFLYELVGSRPRKTASDLEVSVAYELDYEDYMEMDLQFLEVCDALLRLSGESSGADRETSRMSQLGKPILFDFVDVELFIKNFEG